MAAAQRAASFLDSGNISGKWKLARHLTRSPHPQVYEVLIPPSPDTSSDRLDRTPKARPQGRTK